MERVYSKQEKKYEIFRFDDEAPKYNIGVREELRNHTGIYVFFNSQGEPVYVGKATKPLWGESKTTFNRDLGESPARKLSRPHHPLGKEYSPVMERRISPIQFKIHDVARFYSAYEVDDEMISDMEAILVRVCTNSVVNLAHPRFSHFKDG